MRGTGTSKDIISSIPELYP